MMTAHRADETAMRPLDLAETDAVGGGIWAAVGVALTIYAIADIGYDFYQGMMDGASGTVAR